MRATAAGRAERVPLSPTSAVLLGLALAAWIGTIASAAAMDMGAEPGTMGLAVGAFVALWTIMMAAMMLPAVTPVASLYARTVRGHPERLVAFAGGYLLAWTSTGFVALGLASWCDSLAAAHPSVAHGIAVGAFAACGLYQLTPMKRWCLRHCRSPFGHLMRYSSFHGATRDVRAGLHHGLVCVGCCWMLMVGLVAVGVMNVPAMVGLALLIALEKQWRHGELLAKIAGGAAIVFAVAVAFDAGLAPGLHIDDPGPMDMGSMMRRNE